MLLQVSYRDVPGIDCAYLAMDTEEGVEVVWNEATFSETKKFKVFNRVIFHFSGHWETKNIFKINTSKKTCLIKFL